jgi:hypothetical protein
MLGATNSVQPSVLKCVLNPLSDIFNVCEISGSCGGKYENESPIILSRALSSKLSDGGGSKHLCNVGQLLRDYMTQYPRGQSSSSSKSV